MAKKKGLKEFVLDMGMYIPSKGSVVFAALKGAVDAGLSTNFNEEKVPNDKLSNPPEDFKKMFEEIKSKINAG
jgi:large subunit ribosomal protein L18